MYSTHFLLSALCLSATTTAYVIDTGSCKLVARAFLADKLGCAFDMAQNVITELRGPIRQEVQTLMDHLWAPTADPSFYPTAQEAILCRFGGTCPRNKAFADWFQYRADETNWMFPRGIYTMADSAADFRGPSGATRAVASDVVFYCSSDRYKDIKDQDGKDRIKDTSIVEFVEEGTEDPRTICRVALAYTWVSDDPTKPSQITLCPWFLSYVQGLKFPNCGTWKQKLVGLLGRPIAQLSTKAWPFTPIDLLSLFDKVVVHELTHTRHGGQTFDAPVDENRNGAGIGFSNVAYGWKNCKKISTNLPDNGGDKKAKPMNNADSYGLFASGVRIIGAGGSIGADGKVTGLSSSKVKRGPLTAEEREELGALAALFDQEHSGGNEADMRTWGPVFNSTFFPEGTNLSEEQKAMIMKALAGNMPGEAAHGHEH